MDKRAFLDQTRGGVIVSCQALPDEPLYGSEIMARMAVAAQMGGAVAIRCGFGADIRAIRAAVALPVVGLVKHIYPDTPVYITPTMAEVDEVYEAGADVVAIDMTARPHPGGVKPLDFLAQVREKYAGRILLMADISNYDEGVAASEAGADLISTTMSGYTPYSPQLEGPDFILMERLARDLTTPVIGEGRIWTPEEAARALSLGVHAIVVGTAITRPQLIAKRFISRATAQSANSHTKA